MFSLGFPWCILKFFGISRKKIVESSSLIIKDARITIDRMSSIFLNEEKMPPSSCTEFENSARNLLLPTQKLGAFYILTPTHTHSHSTHHYFYYYSYLVASKSLSKQACTHFVFSCAFHKWRTPRYPPSSTSYRGTKTIPGINKIEGATSYFASWRLTSLGLLYSSKRTRYISVRQMRKAGRLRRICEQHTNLATWDARKLVT